MLLNEKRVSEALQLAHVAMETMSGPQRDEKVLNLYFVARNAASDKLMVCVWDSALKAPVWVVYKVFFSSTLKSYIASLLLYQVAF